MFISASLIERDILTFLPQRVIAVHVRYCCLFDKSIREIWFLLDRWFSNNKWKLLTAVLCSAYNMYTNVFVNDWGFLFISV